LSTTPSTSSSSSSSSRLSTSADDSVQCIRTSDVLSLDSIRSSLIRQEETIIFALIERAQFRNNPIVYEKGGLGSMPSPPGTKTPDEDEETSFLEYMLLGTEAFHYTVRRYTSPEEHAFFPDRLPGGEKVLDELEYPSLLDTYAADINFNEILLKKYIEDIVPLIAKTGDDEQYGSCVVCDQAVLQALSRRVHYGKFVAESKYQADPESFQKLVEAGDADGVMELLTNAAVEKKVLRRARLKAATYGIEPVLARLPPLDSHTEKSALVAAAAASAVVAAFEAMGNEEASDAQKVEPSIVESVYRDIIIPLTKDVEVAYLFRRCGKEPPPEYGPDRMSIDIKAKGKVEVNGAS
jgi:chorismate mutase